MFDFFRDMYFEYRGVDSNAAKEERENKLKEKKKDKFIFSKSSKVIVFVLGILYLIIAWFNVATMKEIGALNAYKVIRLLFLTSCDIASLVCLAISKKKTEIAALILILVFVLTQYFTTLFL